MLAAAASSKNYPDPLRRIHFYDAVNDRHLQFITNNFDLPALPICLLYKSRWAVELFFKWVKTHPRIKAFYGYSENAVKTQIWIAVAVYVLVAILKKRLALRASLHEILQVLTSENAVQIQIWTALIAILVLKYLQLKSSFQWSLSNLIALLRQQLFVYRDLWTWLNDPYHASPPLVAAEQLSLEL